MCVPALLYTSLDQVRVETAVLPGAENVILFEQNEGDSQQTPESSIRGRSN